MDRVKINVRERPYSGDINDAQAMQARMLASFLRALGAGRLLAGSGEATNTKPRSFTSGLDVVPSLGGASIVVNPGMLAQYSATWPAVPAALEDEMRVGYVRSAKTIVLPGTTFAWMLLEARVVDVVTLTDSRDILDTVSGDFVPATVDKQIERQVEFQLVDGGTGVSAIPAFSGAPWVPLFAFKTDGSGLWVGAATGLADYDMRNDVADLLGSAPLHGDGALTAAADRNEAEVFSHTVAVAGSVSPMHLNANFHGRVAGQRVWWRALGDASLSAYDDVQNGYAPAVDDLAHFYLVPLVANGVEAWATATFNTAAPGTGRGGPARRGLLTFTNVQPAPGGACASTALQPNAIGRFRNFGSVPGHKAMHVFSCYLKTSAVPYYFSQSRGGHVQIASNAAGLAANLTQIVTWLAGVVTPQTANFDFNGKIPDNARFALVVLQIWPNGGGPLISVDVLRPGGVTPDDSIYNVGLFTVAPALYLTTGVIPVPLLFNTATGTTDRVVTVKVGFSPSPSANNLTVQCRVLGWIY